MFAWFMNMFRDAPARPVVAPAAKVATRRTPSLLENNGPTYLELLRADASLPYPLTQEEEALAAELSLKVIAYVAERKVDPPTMPALAPRVLDALKDPKLDVPRLARTLEQDQAICARLLTVSNSALFSPNKTVTSLHDAITMLGIDQVAQIAIGLATRSLFDTTAKAELAMDRERWNRLFSHGMVTAFTTANLYAEVRRRPSDEAFLGGLFHDVGKAVALQAISAMKVAGEWPLVSADVLEEVLHRVHAYPGNEFYERWTFPEAIQKICSAHHQLEDSASEHELMHWVGLVSSLDALRAGSPRAQQEALDELPICAERLHLNDAQLRSAHTHTKDFADKVHRLFAL